MINSKIFHASVTCIIVFCSLSNSVSGETYTSVEDLEKLISTQESVINTLDSYVNQEMDRLSALAGYLEIFKYEQTKAVANVKKYIGNPINCFLLIKRLTTDLHFIVELVTAKSEFDLDPEPTYPSWEDLNGAARNVARLQQMYQLDVHQLAGGMLRGSYSTPMSSNDCYELGRILYEEKNYEPAKDWLLKSYAIAQIDPAELEQFPLSVVKTVESLCFVYLALNDLDNATKCTKKLVDLAPDDEVTYEVREALEKKEKKKIVNDVVDSEKPLERTSNDIIYQKFTRDYENLCRGEMDLPSDIERRLQCKYLMDKPYLKLAPLKMEQLYINPDVYLFYDVISDSEIERVKTIGIPKLHRSKVKKKMEAEEVNDNDRISMIAWLQGEDDPVVDNIYDRIEDMTGLSTDYVEKLQLAAYVPGGFYRPHYDYLEIDPNEANMGYRIATVMFYFSDVEQGGATVFNTLGLTVFPVKGAALFWYNSHSSGEQHNNTLHAACPVLVGHKWAANIWMLSHGQEFLHPCEIGGDKMDESFVPAVLRLAKSKDVITREDVELKLKLPENEHYENILKNSGYVRLGKIREF